MSRISQTFAALSLLGIVACGGGGSDPEPPANRAPTASAPTNFSAVETTTVDLQGSGTDSDGSIASYAWAQTSGSPSVTLTGANMATASFTAPEVDANTELTFTLTVTDNDGDSGTDSVVVTITPDQAPQAVAPANFQAVENTTVSLDGSGSSDDIAIASYEWVQISGDTVTLSNANTVTASFTAPDMAQDASANFGFRLTVTDSAGATDTDEVIVTVIDTPPTVTLSGTLTFDLVPHTGSGPLNYSNISQQPIRGATVELLNSSNSAILDTTMSDASGDYSFSDIEPTANVIVRVKAEYKQSGTAAWDFTVVDNTSDDAIYAMDSQALDMNAQNQTLDLNAPSGWDDASTEYTTDRVAAPFAILDNIYISVQKFVAVDSNIQFPALRLHWSTNNRSADGGSCTNYDTGAIGTSHYTTRSDCPGIYILGNADSDTDEYDDHVIIHEWGHYFEDKLSRSDSIGGSHGGSDKLDMRVSLGEGYGNALSGMVTDDPVYEDSLGDDQGQGFDINVEDNPSSNRGWYSESSVQSLLYDFYDSDNDGSDSVSLGLGPIYQTLINGEKNTDALTSIFSFANQLKLEAAASSTEIDTLLASQNIVVEDDFGTNETNNGGDARNLPIYKTATVGGGSVEICSFNDNGSYNKLGNRQFVRVDIGTAGTYRFQATGQNTGDDPDLVVYRQGQIAHLSEENGNENSTAALSAGTHIIDVYDYSNVGGSGKDTCIDVTVSM